MVVLELRRCRHHLEALAGILGQGQSAVLPNLGGGAVGERTPRLHLQSAQAGLDPTDMVHDYRAALTRCRPGIIAAVA